MHIPECIPLTEREKVLIRCRHEHNAMNYGIAALGALLCALAPIGDCGAQVGRWQLGGSGLAWSQSDSMRIFVDVSDAAIRPVYIRPDASAFSHLRGWKPLREPREIDFVDGEVPRSWKGSQGNETTAHNGTYMVDGDSMTFNPPVSSSAGSVWYTIDLGVPIPAHRFGFFTPPRGYRSDGTPFALDAVPAYEVSIAAEGAPDWLDDGPYEPIGQVIASVSENFAPRVQIEFPRQYVRFIRYKRLESILDQAQGLTSEVGSGAAFAGTIGDFELFGQGVPRRAIYRTDIFDLGQSVNWGRLHWAATPMRMVAGQLVEVDAADVGVEIEVRTGRDGDPNIYYEYTNRGGEQVVSRARYEFELQPRYRAGLVREPRPGMRASIQYDRDNWSYWTSPISASGSALDLRGGSHIQLRIALMSDDFESLLRLDSLWVDTAPLLAQRVIAEVVRADDPHPARGFTEVEAGRQTDFTCAIRADFQGGENGFNALRIRTGSETVFRSLAIGSALQTVEPLRVEQRDGDLVVHLPQRIDADHPQTVYVGFSASVYALAWTFDGEVFDAAGQLLPQPLEAGNASDEIGTETLRVVVSQASSGSVLRSFELSSAVLTPNGDGVNDVVDVRYALFQLPEAVPTALCIYGLGGQRLVRVPNAVQRAGPQQVRWDGRDEAGRLLPPGLYLVGIEVVGDGASMRQFSPLGLAY